MEGEGFYSVEEAARALRLTPERVEEMLRDGELEGIPPEESGGRGWRVPMRVIPYRPATVPPPPVEMAESPPAEAERAPSEGFPSEEAQEEAAEAVPEQPEPVDTARGEGTATDREPSAPSGWVTTQQAARALGISPRTVRWHIEQGNIAAKPEGEGVRRSWLVSIDSLQAFRDTRQAAGDMPRGHRAPAEGAAIAADTSGNAIRVLAERLEDAAARAAEYRVRLELTEQAESTLRAELEEERRRREAAERERDELRRQLENRPEPREAPPASTAAPERIEPRPPPAAPQRGSRRGALWRRMFGG